MTVDMARVVNKDYYSILGLSKDATDSQIKSAYFKLAKDFHPDKNHSSEAASKFTEVTAAYDVLKDPIKRQQYDLQQQFDFSNFSFSTIRRGSTGKDIAINLDLTFEEVLKGCKKTIKYKKYEKCVCCSGSGTTNFEKQICPNCKGQGKLFNTKTMGYFTINNVIICSKCNGSGHALKLDCNNCSGTGRVLKDSIATLDIDVGVNENIIILKYYGHCGENNGLCGNLVVQLKIKSHEYFARRGQDIIYTAHLSLSQAVLGCKINIKMLCENDNEIMVSPNIINVRQLIIKNKGLPDRITKVRGHEIIEFIVDIPIQLTDKQKILFENLRMEGL